MDLTEEELKATREMRAINKIVAPDEKTADAMFEKLGYKKCEGLRTIDFYNDDGLLQFDKDCKVIHINKNEETDFITMQEQQAINKKVEELSWR